MTTAATQVQMFYAAERHSAAINADFLWLVDNGMTAADLRRCIERRPSLWARFSGWLDVLP